VVVSHRPRPQGWHPQASYHFAASVEEGIARAQELAGEGEIGVGAGEVGGQALSLGLIDHVAIDIVPVVFGRGKPYFGTLANGHLMLEDPQVVIRGDGGCSICVIRCIVYARYPLQIVPDGGTAPCRHAVLIRSVSKRRSHACHSRQKEGPTASTPPAPGPSVPQSCCSGLPASWVMRVGSSIRDWVVGNGLCHFVTCAFLTAEAWHDWRHDCGTDCG